jgi:putative endonuclease
MCENTTEQWFYAYLLTCADGTLYAGWALDPAKRLAQHNQGTGAKYTRARRPVTLLRAWPFATRRQAMQFEVWLKTLTRPQKLRILEKPDLPDGPWQSTEMDADISL